MNLARIYFNDVQDISYLLLTRCAMLNYYSTLRSIYRRLFIHIDIILIYRNDLFYLFFIPVIIDLELIVEKLSEWEEMSTEVQQEKQPAATAKKTAVVPTERRHGPKRAGR